MFQEDDLRESALRYLKTLSQMDFEATASMIDPQDRGDLRREFLLAYKTLSEAGWDTGSLRQGPLRNLGSLEEVEALSAEEFLSLFLRQGVRDPSPLEVDLEEAQKVTESDALVHYKVGSIAGTLAMRLGPYGWRVRLNPGLAEFVQSLCRMVDEFQERAAKDRVVSPEAALFPFAIYGYQNEQGEVILQPRFQQAECFSEGLAAVMVHNRWGYIDRSGKLKIPARYISVTAFREGRAWVCDIDEEFDRHWSLIDEHGAHLTPFEFRSVESFHDGLAAARVKKLWGFVDRSGKWAIKPAYSEVDDFSGGICQVLHPRKGTIWIQPDGRQVPDIRT